MSHINYWNEALDRIPLLAFYFLKDMTNIFGGGGQWCGGYEVGSLQQALEFLG